MGRLLGVGLAVGLLASCGISENDEPQLLAEENVPCVLRDACDATSTTVQATSETETVTVYFVERVRDETRIEAAEREVTRPADALAVLTALFLQPPTDAERSAGLTTSIPDQANLVGVQDQGDGVLLISLSDGFENVTGQGLRVAYAQLVWTATESGAYRGVVFEIEGERQSAVTGDGTPKDEPVRRADYIEFRPES